MKRTASFWAKPTQHHFLSVEKQHSETNLDALSFGQGFIMARALAYRPLRLTYLPSSLASIQDGSLKLSYFKLLIS